MADHFDEKSGVVNSRTPWGTWAQTIEEVFIEVDVSPGTRGKDVKCEIKVKSISCIVHGKEIFKVRSFYSNKLYLIFNILTLINIRPAIPREAPRCRF
jgi:hypothetical protein